MSAFLLRFKANNLEKLCGYPRFSLWILDLLLSRGPTLAQKPLNLVGTVLKCTCKHKDKDRTQEKNRQLS